jgi:uncharacterized repeat protein (TIGR02543 family)
VRRIAILLAAVGALLLIPAAQAFAVPHLKVNITGSGQGEVISVEEELGPIGPGTPPIACSYNGTSASGVCENTPEEPEVPGFAQELLVAQPAAGSELSGWTVQKGYKELCPRESNPLECLILNVEEGEVEFEVTATFTKTVPKFPLAIAKTGEGTVTSSPAGIECTGAKTGAECEASFNEGSMVSLTASPASGFAFSAWGGCTTHVGLTCTVEMSKAKTVKASFVATPSLTIEKAGTGTGKAAATGISCDANCSKATSAIKTGTSVTVKVTPDKGSEAAVFEGGTGSASGCSGAACTFTISENSSVKVKFNPIPTKTLTVKLTGPAAYKGKVSGKGIVKGLTASAISCGTGCTTQTESFFSTDEVTLSAVAGTGYTFAGWSGSEAGTCTGTTTPCTISTSANKTLSAEFK